MKLTGIIILFTSALGTWWLWPVPQELEAREFSRRLGSSADAILVDLRTENEFAEAHVPGALNNTYGSPAFKWRIDELDSTCPVFLYCSSGIRSRKAEEYIRTKGFPSVTLLKGGFNAWKQENLAQTPPELVPPPELNEKSFSRFLDLEHLVIAYFYIPGSKSCRRMGAVLDELSIAYGGNIRILRIDTDKYKYLATEMGLEDVPVLKFYESGNLTGTLEGPATVRSVEERFRLHEYMYLRSAAKETLSAR